MGLRKWLMAHATRLRPVRRGAPHTLPGQLVVSLTSYPARYSILDLTVRRLLSQDMKPDVVVLWIAHQDRAALPRKVTDLQKCGLMIRECEDLRSYKKIIPTLAAYPDAFIVTADDDLMYRRDWLRLLVDEFRSPREILCRSAQRMVHGDLEYAHYWSWPRLKTDGARGSDIFFLSGAGALYPPKSLAVETTDVAQFMRLCPTADDVWLNWMANRAGSTVRLVKPLGPKFDQWPGSQQAALWRSNRASDGGQDTIYDKQIAAMVETYGLLSDVAPVQAAVPQSSAPQ